MILFFEPRLWLSYMKYIHIACDFYDKFTSFSQTVFRNEVLAQKFAKKSNWIWGFISPGFNNHHKTEPNLIPGLESILKIYK